MTKNHSEIIKQEWRADNRNTFRTTHSPCVPSHLGTWLCEGGGHGSEAVVSGKLVWNHKLEHYYNYLEYTTYLAEHQVHFGRCWSQCTHVIRPVYRWIVLQCITRVVKIENYHKFPSDSSQFKARCTYFQWHMLSEKSSALNAIIISNHQRNIRSIRSNCLGLTF
jgi:hypothetical protein